jgi:hypothetical protein
VGGVGTLIGPVAARSPPSRGSLWLVAYLLTEGLSRRSSRSRSYLYVASPKCGSHSLAHVTQGDLHSGNLLLVAARRSPSVEVSLGSQAQQLFRSAILVLATAEALIRSS